MSNIAPLILKKSEERRIRAGHLWVFSNEVDTKITPLTGFEPGQAVEIKDANQKFLGNGYINPHSLICARLVSRDAKYALGRSLLIDRLNIALSLRNRLFDKPYYRLVFGEGDGLPGLVVDRFGDVLVAQITTAGMEQHKEDIVAALQKVLKPTAILFRNDVGIRELEGLDSYVEHALDHQPDQIEIIENNTRFEVPLIGGQKTGWFYDHRQNRSRLQHYAKDKRILDVFSYCGAWGIQAAKAGAADVVCVDSSENALQAAQHNAELNNVSDQIGTLRSDAFDGLKALHESGEKFDIIVVDPPAFIKRRKDKKNGVQAYQRINQLAMRLLNRDGLLVAASCSFHMSGTELTTALLKASRHIDRNMQILEQGHQAADHPVHPAITETNYLKAFFCRVLPTR